MALKFYTSVECGKKVETISQKILGVIPMFVGVTAEKLVWRLFARRGMGVESEFIQKLS